MIRVTLDDNVYVLPSADQALSSLTGAESVLLEDYLGGFPNYGVHTAKTTVVNVWLTLRHAGEPRTLEEIEAIPGLVFGGTIEYDKAGEPEDPMQDPGRPLPETNASNGSNDGMAGSEATPAHSESTGQPASTRSPA